MRIIASNGIDIDRKARMRIPFKDVPIRPPQERLGDFEPTYRSLSPEEAVRAASRCIQCPDPAACYEACPVHNDIPSALWLIEHGDFLGAADLYRKTSFMPGICGQVCPHEVLCMGSCVRVKRAEPVITGALEAFVADYQRQFGDFKIPIGVSSGKRVAIIGSGPAGLSCADQLVRTGHAVTFFEAMPAAGGLLLYGIPSFKLPKDVVKAVIDDLVKAGVEFVFNMRIGEEKTIDDLFNEGFDAVFIGVGTGIDATIKAPGIDLPGIYSATDFLIRSNVNPAYLPENIRSKPEIGDRIVVIGGGDTASDCLRTALRLGVKEVTCLYRRTETEMPGNVKDRKLSKEEGAEFHFLVQPVSFLAGPDGRVSAVECLRCELGEADDSGRRRPVPIDNSNFTVQADTVILALGYWPDESLARTTPELETENWGLIAVDSETMASSRKGVFAGGDAVTGPDLVVTAMVAGRKAAASIDSYLEEV